MASAPMIRRTAALPKRSNQANAPRRPSCFVSAPIAVHPPVGGEVERMVESARVSELIVRPRPRPGAVLVVDTESVMVLPHDVDSNRIGDVVAQPVITLGGVPAGVRTMVTVSLIVIVTPDLGPVLPVGVPDVGFCRLHVKMLIDCLPDERFVAVRRCEVGIPHRRSQGHPH